MSTNGLASRRFLCYTNPVLQNLENFIGDNKQKGNAMEKANLPLIEFIKDWLENKKKNEVKVATLARLQCSANALSMFAIASIPLANITVEDIQEYVNQLIGYGYARGTIKKQMEIVSSPLNYAYLQRIITFDPSKAVKLPAKTRVKKKDKEVVAYDKSQQEKLLGVLKTHKVDGYYAMELMLETGMRVGEILALDWSDVNLTRKFIHVHKTLVAPSCKSKSFVQEGAKSDSSNRKIPLSPRAIELLAELQEKNVEEHEYLFGCATNSRLGYQALTKQCKVICKQVGVPYQGMHVWRHTFATNQYYKGTDVKVLSRILGHANASITYNIYIHLYGDGFEEMLNAVS